MDGDLGAVGICSVEGVGWGPDEVHDGDCLCCLEVIMPITAIIIQYTVPCRNNILPIRVNALLHTLKLPEAQTSVVALYKASPHRRQFSDLEQHARRRLSGHTVQ